MPTYDYRCDACGHTLEIFQSISEPAKKKCPKCGKSKLARLIGAGAGFLFKGGGFYLTDYRSQSYKAAEQAESSGKDGAAKEPKADAPAAKAEPVKAEPAKSEPAEPKAKKSTSKKRSSNSTKKRAS
jgi:putative FmdB family regulatory protein